MYEEAVAKNDTGLLPLCTHEFGEYRKAQKEGNPVKRGDPMLFPTCLAIPSSIGIAPNHRYKASGGTSAYSKSWNSSSGNDHAGYNYQGTTVSEGINGAISIDDPSLSDDEWVAARFLMVRSWNGNDYWLEVGWAENYDVFHDHDQHVYTQQCDTTGKPCIWRDYDEWCDDANNALIYIASQSDDDLWDSFCWDFEKEDWKVMWRDFDSGDDDADRLEAFFEASEHQPGTISMGTVSFYNLELRDATTWHDWTTTYSGDTARIQEGGYTVTTNSKYDDFDVNS